MRLILTISVAMLAVPAWAEDAPSVSDLERWAKELGSDEFQVRQNATRRLIEAGPAAAGTLAKAAEAGDAEVRSRAVKALIEQSLAPRQDQRQSARDALALLADSKEPRAAAAGRLALNILHEATIGLAAAELTRLGATVMPQGNPRGSAYAVQIRQSWTGGDGGLALLADLGNVTWLSIENSSVTDAGLPHIARLTKLQNLYLGDSRLTGRGLAQLAPLASLSYLSLRHLPVDDKSLAELPDFPELQQLGLDGTIVTDAGLPHVARYEDVYTLWLDGTRVTDAGLVHLAPLQSLKKLYLAGTETGGSGLADLHRLPSLALLSLKGVELKADATEHLGQLARLESLTLDDTNITDEQVADLSGLAKLQILGINQTPITDAGVRHLKSLKSLTRVYLSGTQTSQDVFAEVKKSLPRVHFSK